MQAIGYTTGKLYQFECDTPVPEARDILVEVSAIAVNPVDTKIRSRVTPPEGQPKVLGWDAVGTVKAVGSEASLFQVGDRVWYAGDVTRSGCNAQFQCVDERICAKAPSSLSDAEAAAMPLTTITAWEMLFDRLQVPFGDDAKDRRVLVLGAGGGVGSMLVQLLRQLTSATIIATASREESRQWVESLGAHYVLDHREPLAPQLEALERIDNVTDVASANRTGEHYENLVQMLKPQGRLALIDDPSEPLDIKLLKQKCLSLHWEFMFTRAMFTTEDIQQQHELLSRVAELVDAGKLRTTLGEHYGAITADNLERAHTAMKTEHTRGKVVLEGFEGI